jgi:hypothetical protein
MKTIVVLAMHGAPPNGFPKRELAEWFGLHGRMEHAGDAERAALSGKEEATCSVERELCCGAEG